MLTHHLAAMACECAKLILLHAGMFVLLSGMALWEDAGEQLCDWFAPALEWIQRWMALFYAPFLVALPANAASLIGGRPGAMWFCTHKLDELLLGSGADTLNVASIMTMCHVCRAAAATDPAAAGRRGRAQHGLDRASGPGTNRARANHFCALNQCLSLSCPCGPLNLMAFHAAHPAAVEQPAGAEGGRRGGGAAAAAAALAVPGLQRRRSGAAREAHVQGRPRSGLG